MSEAREPTIHRHPRMGVNALAEYMVARAARREAILHEQKYPPVYRVKWYEDALGLIRRYLLDPDHDEGILTIGAQRIRAQPAADRNERQKRDGNAEAVEAFAACRAGTLFNGLTSRAALKTGVLLVEGVTVSVRPEVMISGQYRGHECVGGIKIYLAKNDRLEDDGASAIGALLQRFVTTVAADGQRCHPRHCTVVDVFRSRCIAAPTAIVRRQREVEAACREIANQWPAI